MSLFGDTPPQPNFQDDDHLLLFKLASAAYNLSLGGGGGSSGITALTGDVTASGSGSVAATVAKIQGVAISGAAAAGNVLTASGPTAASWAASSGSPRGLPIGTYTAGSPGAEQFQPNSAIITGTSQIQLGSGYLEILGEYLPGSSSFLIIFTGIDGKSWAFRCDSIAAGLMTGGIVNDVAADVWSGVYQLSFAPSAAGPQVDSVNGAVGVVVLTTSSLIGGQPVIADGTYAISSSLGGSVSFIGGLCTAWNPAP